MRTRRSVDRYLDANQRSESFVPVPCYHVPYLSQIHWCSRTGRVDPHFQTGPGTRKSVLHYPLYNLTGTLEARCKLNSVWEAILLMTDLRNTKLDSHTRLWVFLRQSKFRRCLGTGSAVLWRGEYSRILFIVYFPVLR